jgi:hypothetical protein
MSLGGARVSRIVDAPGSWLGEAAGHVVSTVSLSLLIFGCGSILSGSLDIATPAEAWSLGAVWLVLMITFEFLGGRFLFGVSWDKLLADYDLTAGRIWLLVLVTTFLTPRLVYHLKR